MSASSTEKPLDVALAAISKWFDALERYADDFPAKGTISGALVVLERLKQDYNLNIDAHTAKGGSQIKGASGAAVKRILAGFGEPRRFVSEGGRTNRGLRGDIRTMLQALCAASLDKLVLSERNTILETLQRLLTGKVTSFFELQRLDCKYSPNLSAYQFVSGILKAARERGKEGAVAQYLVGAKLQLRFPAQDIENKCASTADAPQDKHGDFCVGGTIFHVTVAPMPPLVEKCQQNLEENLRPWLLVPERSTGLFRAEIEQRLTGPFTLSSIENFVAQNVSELAGFSDELLPKQLLQLLEIYNERVAAVEIDRSMQIETPSPLLRLKGKK
jgi:hypothetical protein